MLSAARAATPCVVAVVVPVVRYYSGTMVFPHSPLTSPPMLLSWQVLMTPPQAVPLPLPVWEMTTPQHGPDRLPIGLTQTVLDPGPSFVLRVTNMPTMSVLMLGSEWVAREVLSLATPRPPGPDMTLLGAGPAFLPQLSPTRLVDRSSSRLWVVPMELPVTAILEFLGTLLIPPVPLEHRSTGPSIALLIVVSVPLRAPPKLLTRTQFRQVPRLTLFPVSVLPGRTQLENPISLMPTFLPPRPGTMIRL